MAQNHYDLYKTMKIFYITNNQELHAFDKSATFSQFEKNILVGLQKGRKKFTFAIQTNKVKEVGVQDMILYINNAITKLK